MTLCVVCHVETHPVLTEVTDVRFGVPGQWNIAACPKCGLETISPRPTAQELTILYEKYYNYTGRPDSRYASIRQRFLELEALYRFWLLLDGDVAFHAVTAGGRLLDVGCNEGRGMARFLQNGFTPEGIDLNSVAIAQAQAAGFTATCTPIEDFDPPHRYDILVMSNVLEHHLDPVQCLSHCHRLLAPNGQLWISCPNRRSLLRNIFGRAWINWHVPFHISHFSNRDLSQLLTSSGFKVVNEQQVTPALWFVQSLVARLTSRPGTPNTWMRKAAIIAPALCLVRGLGFPILWLMNRLGRGDCLLVRAVKVA
jgi:2-polyprenyl-3-methyl-5-hydroxy-6-metoxy-1,4-benzoquinol methylase